MYKTRGIYLSKGSSTNHLQNLKVFFVKTHLLHFGREVLGCGEEESRGQVNLHQSKVAYAGLYTDSPVKPVSGHINKSGHIH